MLEQFIALNLLAFMLTFVRVGTAVMVMPGIGDSFVPSNIRLYFAMAFSVVLAPLVSMYMPTPMPTGGFLLMLIVTEFITGLFIGTVARILMSATDTAGMIVSFQAGLSNAQLFNPMMASQGSLVGAFFSVTAATLLFQFNLHHLMLAGLIESYQRFPMAELPDVGSMADVIARSVAAAFLIGTQMAAPFLVLILLLYAAMGVLTRLMPQVQIFMIAMPVQILLSLLLMALVMSAGMMFFIDRYQAAVGSLLGG